MQERGLTERELTLAYNEFVLLIKEIKKELHPIVLKWLNEWEMFDLMFKYGSGGDDERKFVRLGHYMAYTSIIEE